MAATNTTSNMDTGGGGGVRAAYIAFPVVTFVVLLVFAAVYRLRKQLGTARYWERSTSHLSSRSGHSALSNHSSGRDLSPRVAAQLAAGQMAGKPQPHGKPFGGGGASSDHALVVDIGDDDPTVPPDPALAAWLVLSDSDVDPDQPGAPAGSATVTVLPTVAVGATPTPTTRGFDQSLRDIRVAYETANDKQQDIDMAFESLVEQRRRDSVSSMSDASDMQDLKAPGRRKKGHNRGVLGSQSSSSSNALSPESRSPNTSLDARVAFNRLHIPRGRPRASSSDSEFDSDDSSESPRRAVISNSFRASLTDHDVLSLQSSPKHLERDVADRPMVPRSSSGSHPASGDTPPPLPALPSEDQPRGDKVRPGNSRRPPLENVAEDPEEEELTESERGFDLPDSPTGAAGRELVSAVRAKIKLKAKVAAAKGKIRRRKSPHSRRPKVSPPVAGGARNALAAIRARSTGANRSRIKRANQRRQKVARQSRTVGASPARDRVKSPTTPPSMLRAASVPVLGAESANGADAPQSQRKRRVRRVRRRLRKLSTRSSKSSRARAGPGSSSASASGTSATTASSTASSAGGRHGHGLHNRSSSANAAQRLARIKKQVARARKARSTHNTPRRGRSARTHTPPTRPKSKRSARPDKRGVRRAATSTALVSKEAPAAEQEDKRPPLRVSSDITSQRPRRGSGGGSGGSGRSAGKAQSHERRGGLGGIDEDNGARAANNHRHASRRPKSRVHDFADDIISSHARAGSGGGAHARSGAAKQVEEPGAEDDVPPPLPPLDDQAPPAYDEPLADPLQSELQVASALSVLERNEWTMDELDKALALRDSRSAPAVQADLAAAGAVWTLPPDDLAVPIRPANDGSDPPQPTDDDLDKALAAALADMQMPLGGGGFLGPEPDDLKSAAAPSAVWTSSVSSGADEQSTSADSTHFRSMSSSHLGRDSMESLDLSGLKPAKINKKGLLKSSDAPVNRKRRVSFDMSGVDAAKLAVALQQQLDDQADEDDYEY